MLFNQAVNSEVHYKNINILVYELNFYQFMIIFNIYYSDSDNWKQSVGIDCLQKINRKDNTILCYAKMQLFHMKLIWISRCKY